MEDRVEKLSQFLIDNHYTDYALYGSRNLFGDIVEEIYNQDGIIAEICKEYHYIDIVGLSDDEFDELEDKIKNYK